MELIWPAICFLLGVLVTYTWLHPGWLRQALRRELRRRSRKPKHFPKWYGRPCSLHENCTVLHPQPASQQPSDSTTGTGPGPNEPPSVSHDGTHWRRAGRESED
ncbi:hypothetical protein LCGC14_1411030 [marine sediment metagenome]|uniref:Uncharacterized protein n=1 Tax=marine sediment metagenome TaxID=412755 RepID=A0A0F9JUD3_9ZZZZ